MPPTWPQRIDRAAALAAANQPNRDLLTSYGRLLTLQRDMYGAAHACADALTGALGDDLPMLRDAALRTIRAAAGIVPAATAADVPSLTDGIDALLRDGWRSSSPPFFARLVLQPYAECLAAIGRRPAPRLQPAGNAAACPFCGGPPQLSILRPETRGEAGGRVLQCAMCATEWPFRRVLCAACGEEDERRLAYFHTAELDHLRVDACDTCRHYLKSVDLTRLGTAVASVDEVAGAALDVWALERGYRKIELNLVGL